jgi:3-hydroxybutyryl-CoA dehydrogenase
VTGSPTPPAHGGASPTIGIVGAGAMGTGIAQVALEAGSEVVIYDVEPAAIARAREGIRQGLERRAAKLELDADTIEAWATGRLERLRQAHTLDAITAEAELVVEAALEDLGLKREIFRALDAGAPLDTILASNTSALSIGAIASVTAHPERVLGLHFFNPVPRMALVEVVPGPATTLGVVRRAEEIVRTWGKTPVRCTDTPGFIVNRVNRPFTIQALRILEAGEASVETIDQAMRDAGYPMGPFELMDLAGLDVNLAAARGVWEGLGSPEHLRPSEIQERLVAAGRHGRKTDAGFYEYADGRRGAVAAEFEEGPQASTVAAADIAERILAAIDDEAHRALADGVASEADIDTALRLGAGHPHGPFERHARSG